MINQQLEVKQRQLHTQPLSVRLEDDKKNYVENAINNIIKRYNVFRGDALYMLVYEGYELHSGELTKFIKTKIKEV